MTAVFPAAPALHSAPWMLSPPVTSTTSSTLTPASAAVPARASAPSALSPRSKHLQDQPPAPRPEAFRLFGENDEKKCFACAGVGTGF